MTSNQAKPIHHCDGCTACCKTMKVRELDKPGNTWCPHCKIGEGCGIYETRPESCRVYECVWLKTQRAGRPIPFELRPDKSRVVIGTTNQGEEIVLYVSPDQPDAWRRGAFHKLVTELLSKGITVLVSRGETLEKL